MREGMRTDAEHRRVLVEATHLLENRKDTSTVSVCICASVLKFIRRASK